MVAHNWHEVELPPQNGKWRETDLPEAKRDHEKKLATNISDFLINERHVCN